MSLRADIRHRLDYLLVPDRLKRIDALKLKIEELERERAEVRQHIPLWDRIAFFSDTPDEAREGEIALKLEAAQELGEEGEDYRKRLTDKLKVLRAQRAKGEQLCEDLSQ